MPGFHIEHVMLTYFINHKKGEGAGPTPKSALEYWPLDLHVPEYKGEMSFTTRKLQDAYSQHSLYHAACFAIFDGIFGFSFVSRFL